MRDDRTFIRVHDGMPDHPKIEALSDKAFRLLVERWCWCSRHRTDGLIPRAVWLKSSTPTARRELVAAGLVEERGEHVMMHDYLQHQRSAEEIADLAEAKRRGAAIGNHNRWHEAQGKYDPSCPICVADGSQERSVERDLERSQNASLSDRKTSPDTYTEKEKEKRSRRTAGGYTPEFEQWWLAYPKRNGSKGSKFEASKGWAKAVSLVTPDDLLAATKRYADSPRVREGFAKDAATWLNQRCWEEFTSGAGPSANVDDWLKGEWKVGRVRFIEERTGLRYPQPDLPLDLPQERVERWLVERCREWIAANHELIIGRLTGRESA